MLELDHLCEFSADDSDEAVFLQDLNFEGLLVPLFENLGVIDKFSVPSVLLNFNLMHSNTL